MSRKSVSRTPFELDIDSLAHDGRGVGRHEGKAVFVDGALPGERVRVRLTKKRRNYDLALLEEILVRAPDRVEPRCAHFGVCGGCSLQHLEPAAQLQARQAILGENLRRIGQVEPARRLEPLQADIWGYRGKARLGVRYVPGKGRVLVGFREKGKPFITDTRHCDILVPEVGGRIEALSALIGALSIREQVPQIEVAAGEETCCLIFRTLAPLSDDDRSRLLAFGREHGFDICIQPGGPDTVEPLDGPRSPLYYRLPDWGLELQFEPQDFTQVNLALNRRMVRQAVELLEVEPGERVLDLFCGLGNFSLPLARTAGRVTGVEGDREMVARAGRNAALNGIDNADFHCADLFEPPGDVPWLPERVDKVLLDPPRSGAEAVVEWLPALAPERIVYVSCNPSTLARDAAVLVHRGGYKLEAAGVMDMFPHTAHSEAMAVFCKGG